PVDTYYEPTRSIVTARTSICLDRKNDIKSTLIRSSKFYRIPMKMGSTWEGLTQEELGSSGLGRTLQEVASNRRPPRVPSPFQTDPSPGPPSGGPPSPPMGE